MAAAAVFAATLLFRWITVDFDNDYFMHLAWAAAMLHGQMPVRDFVEPGFIGQTLLAYAGFRLGGYQLFWEAVTACGLIATGAALTYAVCRLLNVPRWLSLSAVVAAVVAYPRLYAYPKVFVYPLMMWVTARYLARPSRGRLIAVAAAGALAFLLRDDHGVWSAAFVAVAVIARHWGDGRRTVGRVLAGLAVAATCAVLPWALWVASSGQAVQYVRLLTSAGGSTTHVRMPRAPLSFDVAAPWLAMAQIQYPEIRIRWAGTTTPADRRVRQREYGLQPIDEGAGRYVLTNTARPNVIALLQDPAVEDTAGIDRGNGQVPQGAFARAYLAAQRYVPLLRIRLAPGVIDARNAQPWLTLVTFGIPWVVLLWVAFMTRPDKGEPGWFETTLVIAIAVLSMLTYQTLVRDSTDSRLGDVAPITAVLLAWTGHRAWSVRGRGRIICKVGTIAALSLVCMAAGVYGRTIHRLSVAAVDGPTGLYRRVVNVAREYRQRPLAVFGQPGASGLPQVYRWLNACTASGQQVAVIGFEPQIYVVSERDFAGGAAFFDVGWNDAPEDQRLTIARWSRQQVPVVIAMDTEWNAFVQDYPLVHDWLEQHYDRVLDSTLGGRKGIAVWIDRRVTPLGSDADTGLPCFVAPQPAS